jgi:hypothetical protein
MPPHGARLQKSQRRRARLPLAEDRRSRLRPVFHWTAPRGGGHVLLCVLAYYLPWHMRQSLAPMLFDEPDPAARDARRTSPVAKVEPSPAAPRKAARKRTELADDEPLPAHSFHTLLGDLATLTRNVVRLGRDRLTAILATPTRDNG